MATRVTVHGRRFYQVPGSRVPYPSVTSILSMIHKPWLQPWHQRIVFDHIRTAFRERPRFNNDQEELAWIEKSLTEAGGKPEQMKQEAANLGTLAHNFIDEHLLQGMPAPDLVPPHLLPIIQGFESWRKQAGLVFVRRDATVYSKTYQYAGAFDALAKKAADNSLVLIDWKTSNRISSEYAYQIAAYAHALGEMTNNTVDEAWVVRFDKTQPTFEVKKVRNLDESFQVFLSALHLFRAQEAYPWKSEEAVYEDLEDYELNNEPSTKEEDLNLPYLFNPRDEEPFVPL